MIDGGVSLQEMISGTTQRLQAVSAASDKVVWASGTGGTWVLTVDGGRSWTHGVVPGADSLEFRDVQAVNNKEAYLLSSGPGRKSRIYRTEDAGENWQLQYLNTEPEAFFDCIGFWDEKSGLAFSDNVNGRFPVLRTENGGQRWTELTNLPPATKGEGAFAASGTCIATHGSKLAWIATGAGESARLLFTADRGASWTSLPTPIAQGTSTTGHTSVGFRTAEIGFAAGGDISDTLAVNTNVVLTRDGGKSWTVGGHPSFRGGVYGAVYVPGTEAMVAVGPKGSSWSPDGGVSWQPLDQQNYWSVSFAAERTGWMVGPKGTITKVVLPK